MTLGRKYRRLKPAGWGPVATAPAFAGAADCWVPT